MKIRIIAAVAFAFCFCSCGNRHDVGGGDFKYMIYLDTAERVEAPLISEFCSDVSTIILEIDDNVPMASVDKIIHIGNRLYISDRIYSTNGANIIAEFDMDGKFIRRYGNRGRGPGEYIGISDFAVDEKEHRLYILDSQTSRIISYDLDNGKFVGSTAIGTQKSMAISIASVGDLLYTDIHNFEYDKSNYILKSWKKTDPTTENHYLPIGKYLPGWIDTSLISNNRFIFRNENIYCLFSNKFSNEIFKITPYGIENYLSVESKYLIDEKDRQTLSMTLYRKPGDPPAANSFQILRQMERFHEIRDYFETEGNIYFTLLFGWKTNLVMYDKSSGETRMSTGLPKNDRIVKSDYLNTLFLSLLQADVDGVFYGVQPEDASKLRTAAREGMLVDGLDRLDELKELDDFDNPVLFYLKFKAPLR